MNIPADDETFSLESLVSRLRGLPDSVIELLWDPFELPSQDFGGILMSLPEGWTPKGSPSLEEVRLAARMGVGVAWGSCFDLEWLGSDIRYITALMCSPTAEQTGHLERIEEASSLRCLMTPFLGVEGVIDISHLTQLRKLVTGQSAFLGGFGLPRLEDLRYMGESLPDGVRTGPAVAYAVFDVARFDAKILENSSGLRNLQVERARHVDLNTFAGFTSLEHLSLRLCKRVTGVEGLSRLPSLRELQMAFVTKLAEPEQLLDLDQSSLHAWGTPDLDPELVRRAKESGLTWSVSPVSKPADIVRVSEIWEGGGYEVTFDEWNHLAAALGPDEGDLPSTEDVERVLRRAVEVHGSRALRQSVLYDSEAEAVIVQVPNRRSANRVRDIWLQELHDPDILNKMRPEG
ncbi:hypothetical protein [Microbacterium sp. RURRCA19A]|uniref:hypothetical protein n=1 Tax=Microbacterium sp. RURRCA19A TaxID=1907391 RepID=UPI000954FA2C|nr:hypothetical protein [Microbacterium sp. RURRCA19A]SIS12993.1 hypothetical protein SAMN05880568_2904 [Microbacterium sp. RURRCA19A]